MTTQTNPSERDLIPFRHIAKGDYLSVGGEWRCTRQDDGTWTLVNVRNPATKFTGLKTLIEAQYAMAGRHGEVPPTENPENEKPTTLTGFARAILSRHPGDLAGAVAEAKAHGDVKLMAAVQALGSEPAAAEPAPAPAAPAPVPTESETRAAFKKLAADLNHSFKERREVIEQSLAAVLTGENVLMLGPPGTAKSALVRAIARALGATYFERLLTKQSKPDELFGPPSLAALKEGRYEREIAGFLPTVHFGFVDETFKANGAILNALLSLMNERIFHNGNVALSCPLISLFGASNEGPESKELDAVYDRFLIRVMVNYVDRDDNFRALVKDPEPTSGVSLSLETLKAAQAEVAAVRVTDDTVDAMLSVRNALKAEQIIVSDRRFKKIAKLLRAFAWMDGAAETDPEYLTRCVDALWAEPTARPKIIKIVGQFSDMVTAKVDEITRAADESYRNGDNGGSPSKRAALRQLQEQYAKLRDLAPKAKGKKRESVEQALKHVERLGSVMRKQVEGTL